MFKKCVSFLLLLLALAGLISCAARVKAEQSADTPPPEAHRAGYGAGSGEEQAPPPGSSSGPEALDELAELERSGGFVPGLGLAESKLREEAGDYAGAVLAVFKELSWAYALGAGDVTRAAIRQGLEKLLEPDSAADTRLPAGARKEIALAVGAILAFFEGRYEEAEKQLAAVYGGDAEVDGFSRYLLLVCALERGGAGREERSLYSSIRARYAGFPEYWYHFARSENSGGNSLSGDGPMAAHAERCINLAPAGPYAAECRVILARAMGLKPEDAPALKTRLEIEAAVTGAVNQQRPELLSELLPLAALPDNPSTLYASGAMRALAAESLFRNWFIREAEKARGRLAERLLYISRG